MSSKVRTPLTRVPYRTKTLLIPPKKRLEHPSSLLLCIVLPRPPHAFPSLQLQQVLNFAKQLSSVLLGFLQISSS